MREMRDLEFPSAIKISLTSLVLQHINLSEASQADFNLNKRILI